MIPASQMSSALRPLALGLAMLVGQAIAAPAFAQSAPPDTADLRDTLAKRPAKLKRPPPELSAPAPIVRSATTEKSSTDRLAAQPSEVIRAPAPRVVAPREQAFAPAEQDQDFIIVDENGEYGPGVDSYGVDSYGAGSNCNSRGRIWVQADALAWMVEGFNTPALVTTSPIGTAQANAGILGLPTTEVLFGNSRLTDQTRGGLRLTAGGWFNSTETTGLQVSAFGLKTDHHNFAANSAQFPIIARPFFNVEPGFEGQDAELIAFPGLFNGQIDIHAESTLFGSEALLRRRMAQECWCRVDGLLGVRYVRLDEQLQISDNRTVVGGGAGVAIGTTFQERDLFETLNQFYGGEIGVVAECRGYGFSVEGTLKLALGVNRSSVQISGASTATIPVPAGPPIVVQTPAGLLAQGTNIGTYTSDDFSVIPEVGVNIGYEITPRLRVTAGYTFFYWTDVVRPGDQIDTNLNLSQLAPGGLVGIPSPQFNRVIDNVWVQGVNLGLDFRF